MTTQAIAITVNQTLMKYKKKFNYVHIILMIQHKKYDNETTDDMIKNEHEKYKKSSYDEIRELVMEKEKGNHPVEDKTKKKKMKIFKNNNSNQKDYTKLFNLNNMYKICSIYVL